MKSSIQRHINKRKSKVSFYITLYTLLFTLSSLGLNSYQTMTKIILPQALKNIFPTLCNEFIVLIKETAIVGYVGLMDIQKAGDFIKSATYIAFMPLIGTAIIYYVREFMEPRHLTSRTSGTASLVSRLLYSLRPLVRRGTRSGGPWF